MSCLAWAYPRSFFYGDRPLHSNIGAEFTRRDYRRPHADVMVSLVSIVDEDITERKIHDFLAKYEKRTERRRSLKFEKFNVIDRNEDDGSQDFI